MRKFIRIVAVVVVAHDLHHYHDLPIQPAVDKKSHFCLAKRLTKLITIAKQFVVESDALHKLSNNLLQSYGAGLCTFQLQATQSHCDRHFDTTMKKTVAPASEAAAAKLMMKENNKKHQQKQQQSRFEICSGLQDICSSLPIVMRAGWRHCGKKR